MYEIYNMDDKTIYLLVSLFLLLLTELLPFLPTRSHGIIHALSMVASDSLDAYKSRSIPSSS